MEPRYSGLIEFVITSYGWSIKRESLRGNFLRESNLRKPTVQSLTVQMQGRIAGVSSNFYFCQPGGNFERPN